MPTNEAVAAGLVAALQRAGFTITEQPDPDENPCRVGLSGAPPITLVVHSARLTPQRRGGPTPSTHGRPEGEWHMQMIFDGDQRGSGIRNHLRSTANGTILLLGYVESPDGRVYAAYDPRRHQEYAYSKSLQVKEDTLDDAAEHGIAFQLRANGEVIVGFREEFFPWYLEQAAQYHTLRAPDLVAVRDAAERDIAGAPPTLAGAAGARERRVGIVSRVVRDRLFSRAVRSVYRCCATCGLRFPPVLQGAHIIPVTEPGSSDTYDNALGLCPLCHRLYDEGYILIDDQANITLNETKIAAEGHPADVTRLRGWRRSTLWEPSRPEHRPSRQKLGQILRQRA